MKKGWDRYAEKRHIKKGYFRKYRNRSESGQASKTSDCDSIQQSRESPEEEIGVEDESIRKENASEAFEEGRQRVPESNSGRCETQEENSFQTKGEKMKKQSKEKKHEMKESKAYEKKEDKKEKKRAK